MYTLPQPNVAGVAVEGCPVVEVHDDSGDWKHLLEVLYDGTILTEETIQFSLVAALIRLGRKYDFIKLLKAAVKRLTHDYPSTLALIDARQRADFSLNIAPYPGIHFDALSMAREHSIPSVLPIAYYWMIRAYPQTSWFDGLERPDGTSAHLAPGDLRVCLKAANKIFRTQFKDGYSLGWMTAPNPSSCLFPTQCPARRAEMLQKCIAVDPLLSGAQLVVESLSAAESWVKRCCTGCQPHLMQLMHAGRARGWEELPAFFDLPPWADLKNDL
uniref:BTB domain-containing protein n=1 Tax=Mycena chlorophos TaxID=658473 RepID=A0ABQ0LYN4_MYCCL|nr:predicted protein [Mycena chlorophos]